MQRRGSTSFWMRTKKRSWNGKTYPNHVTSILVRHSLNGATFLADFHITAIGYIALRTRPTCIIANYSFSKNGIKMCQHIYNTPFLKRNKCPPSIVQMVYVEVVLGKQVDQRTIEIQLMLNMIAHLELFVGLGRKYPHGVLEKKMATKEVPNPLVVWLDTSSDDEKTGCALVKRRLIEASIKGRMVENAFNNMVDNDNVEGPYLLLATEGRDYGHEGDGNGPTMDEGMPKVEAPIDLFGKISELEVELPTSRALVEEYKAKVEPGEVTFL
jgi:hypothetical protein